MGQAALTIVGAVVGSFIPGVGTAAGAAIGGAIGGYVFAPDVEGPRLQTGAPKNFDYGWPIRRIYGRRRIADPFKAWQSPLIEDANEQDAKGGPQQTTYSYRSHVRYIVGKRGPSVLLRVFINKEPRWTALLADGEASIAASAQTDAFTSITFMDGNPDQLPWSIEELYEGADNVTAARGLCCIAIESLQHGFSENPPLVEFEVTTVAELVPQLTLMQSRFLDAAAPEGRDESAYARGTPVQTGGGNFGITSFDVNNDNVAYPLAPQLLTYPTFPSPGGSIAFECIATWTEGVGEFMRVNGFPGSDTYQALFQWDTGTPGAVTMLALPGPLVYTSPAPVPPNCHFVIQFSPTGVRFYVDGELVASAAISPWPVGNQIHVRVGSPGSGTTGNTIFSLQGFRVRNEETYTGSSFTPLTEIPPPDFGAVTPGQADLAETVAAELQEGALTPPQYDVSALEGIPVDGWETARSPRQGIEELMLVHNFDWVCAERLEARLLGGASSATFAYTDLGAGVDEADPEAFNPERGNDQEVPYKRELAYINITDKHAVGVVEQSRHVTASAELRRDSVNVAMTPERAQGVVDTIVARARVEATTATVKVTEKHVRSECTDVVTVVDEDGTTFRKRITQDTYSRGIHTFALVLDDAQAYRTEGITFDSFTETIVVAAPGTVDLVLIDGPLLRDADNVPGGYAAFDLDANARSARLLSSADGTNYAQRLVCTDDAAIGITADALAAPANPYVWDEASTFTATLSGTVSSSTREAMQLDRQLNTLIVGTHGRWEVVRFRTATLIDSTDTTYTYTFSGLIRADYGTEHAMASHEAGDTVVVLRVGFGIRSVEQSISEIGLTRYWKAPADGRPSSTADDQALAFDSERLKPRSPTRARCARDTSGNAVIAMDRRTRFATRAGGPGGSVFPIGEAVESYEVDVYADDSFAAVVRTLTTWAPGADGQPAFPYSAADQAADGFTPGDPLPIRASQLSALVGRGHELEAIV